MSVRPGGPAFGAVDLAGPRRNLIGGIVFVLAVAAIAIVAYAEAGWPLGDALYMTVLTVFTVGFEEVRPVDTALLRTITIGLILFGCTGIIFVTGALVQFITVRSLTDVFGVRRMQNAIAGLTGHTIICGYGRIGRMLARDLAAARSPFVVVDQDPHRCAEARADACLVVEADAAEEVALAEAGVARARVLATVLPNDAANVFITLSAKSMNDTLVVIARGEAPSTERKLLHAGARHVVLPAHIGADRIAELILYPATVALVREPPAMRAFGRDLARLGFELVLAVVERSSPFAGSTVEAVERETGFLVVAVERPGDREVLRPSAGDALAQGDGVTLLGRIGAPLAAGFAARA